MKEGSINWNIFNNSLSLPFSLIRVPMRTVFIRESLSRGPLVKSAVFGLQTKRYLTLGLLIRSIPLVTFI